MTANKRVKVTSLRDLWQQFREMNSRSSRRDHRKRTTVFGGGIGFRIARIQVAGSSPKERRTEPTWPVDFPQHSPPSRERSFRGRQAQMPRRAEKIVASCRCKYSPQNYQHQTCCSPSNLESECSAFECVFLTHSACDCSSAARTRAAEIRETLLFDHHPHSSRSSFSRSQRQIGRDRRWQARMRTRTFSTRPVGIRGAKRASKNAWRCDTTPRSPLVAANQHSVTESNCNTILRTLETCQGSNPQPRTISPKHPARIRIGTVSRPAFSGFAICV